METKTIKTNGEPIKILTKKDTSKEVSVENIPGVNIEQLYVGQEVQRPREVRGEFNTNDASLTRVNNFYNLNLPDPENEIFSFAIDGIDMTFGVGSFGGDPTLAYGAVETQLQEKLGDMYTVEYVGSGDFTIVKEFERTITFSERDLVRNIEFTDWNIHTKVDVIIDGQTIAIDGQTYPFIADAIDHIISELNTSIYYSKRDGTNNLVIARVDATIPVITQTDYDRYTYLMRYRNKDTPFNEKRWINTTTTIDGISNVTNGYEKRNFEGDWIIRNITGLSEEITSTYPNSLSLDDSNSTTFRGNLMTTGAKLHINTITKNSATTATRAVIRNSSGVVLHTANFVGDEATFDVILDANTSYQIGADSNGASFTSSYWGNVSESYLDPTGTIIWDNFSSSQLYYCIQSISYDIVSEFTGYNFEASFTTSLGDDDEWIVAGADSKYFNYYHYATMFKDDYSAIVASTLSTYTNGYTDLPPDSDTAEFLFTETNNLVTITITNYTEITPTFTLSGNNFFIRVDILPRVIQIGAYSTLGTSIGTYEDREQSTTPGDGSPTVQGRIFQTDANNYGTIIKLVKGGFVINFTTTVGNIINYTCR